ncbi:SdpI family protein [Lentilactobacillus hilgardii]|uniref:SdpI family protein n=1 Tax=Lentilactobacillus hilgardii TaxID=1588 RepID=UPI0009D6EADC|nr:SdpI family protein [Lentilactobacillus hilgardii]QEU39656.1 SdpI family protein [Lentilactobacillus hilgardii]QIR10714.1 hypothetical protein G8J22_02725 [Lentilactobacillus hilgardii]TDG85200.1 hypothetical protein C5L34_000872 [Lentilactobacillus hilgardii]
MSGLTSSIAILVLLLLFCIAYIVNPIKSPSNYIGYRTKLSRSSNANWQLSQKLFYCLSISCQLILVIANAFIDISVSTNSLILLGYMFIIFVMIQSILYNRSKIR